MRVRVRYSKTGKLRFVSAIDLGRIWERSLRRADLPIAYSEGFSPHPKVSFPDALTLGWASTGEYAELTFAGRIDLDAGVVALNAAFPDGMAVLAAVEVGDGDPRLAKWLRASTWDLRYPVECAAALDRLAAAMLAADELLVARDRKGEITEVDARPAIHDACAGGGGLRVTIHHVEPPIRPSEVHLALSGLAEGSAPLSEPIAALTEPALVTRVAQGSIVVGGLREAVTGAFVPRSPDPESTLPGATTTRYHLLDLRRQ